MINKDELFKFYARNSKPNDTSIIGDHLYLIEGAIRWALYDLMVGSITAIDSNSGELLKFLSKIDVVSDQKRRILENQTPIVWQKISKLNINERIFELDKSPKPKDLSLDLLWLEITEVCNQQCIHCYAKSNNQSNTIMGIDFAKEIVRQGCEAGFKKIQFTGGEPFTHPYLWELVRFTSKLDYAEIEIYTNLTLLKDNDIKLIKRLGINIATSLFGYDALSHDFCTKTEGSFNRWYERIKKIQSLGINYRIGVVRMKENEAIIDKVEVFLRDKKLIHQEDSFKPDDLRLIGRGGKTSKPPKQHTEYELHLNASAKFFYLSHKYNPCWRGELAVSPKGQVFPCVFARQITIGDLKTETISTILDRVKQSYWTITLDQVEKCRDCEFRYACMDCRALVLNNGGGLYDCQIRCNYDPYQ